jgi:hypothetical protein
VQGSTQAQIQPKFGFTSSGEFKMFRFTVSSLAGNKAEFRKNQIYQFLESEGIAASEIEKAGTGEFSYEIKKPLTVEEVINIFDNFMS